MRLPRRAAAAFALLVGAWVIAPNVMPLYDGPGQPDEPYRYVVAPPGDTKKTPPATSATATLPLGNGVNRDAAFANSAEMGPQVRVYIPSGWLRGPAGATTIQVTAVPSAPKPPLPTDGPIVGNVYTVSATASGGPVEFVGTDPNNEPVIQLRAPTQQQPGPTFETFDGKKWKVSKTTQVGQDVYQTFAPKLGIWALVQRKGGSSGMSGGQLLLLVLGIAILAVVGIIVVIRLVRSAAQRSAQPAKRPSAQRGSGGTRR